MMTCVANVTSESGWTLKLCEADFLYRVEVSDSERHRMTYSLLESLDDAFGCVRTFFEVEGLPHVGVVLVEAARCELRMSDRRIGS